MTAKALFLSLDGIDGTGKSTQIGLLADWLRDRRARRGDVRRSRRHARRARAASDRAGAPARSVGRVRGAAVHGQPGAAHRGGDPPGAGRRAHRRVGSLPVGHVVYQGHAGRLGVDQLWQVGQLSTGGLEPDLTLVLDLPVERRLEPPRRRAADRMESKPIEYHRRVRTGFLTEAQRHPEKIRVIDASGNVEAVQAEVRRQVAALLDVRPATGSPQ